MENNTSNTGIIVTIVIVILVIIGAVAMMKKDTDDMVMNDTPSAMMENPAMNAQTTPAEEGVMVGGAMMVKSKDIVDNVASASNVTTVVAAVKAAGLVETLKGTGPFTVFAPNNAAFEKLPKGTVENLLKPENKAMLAKILTYHVVAGRYTSADLTDGQMLKTVQGETIKISKSANGTITINGTAMVETADVISSNGVTFVIDTVLMPSMK